MSLEFMDGFDHYQTFSQKWDNNASGNNSNQTPARFGGGSASFFTGTIALSQGQLSAVSTRIIGFALYINNSGIAAGGIVNFLLAGTTQCDLRYTSTGQLQVTRNGTVLGTSTFQMLTFVWYYIEISVTINGSTGAFDVHVNGTSVLSASGVNTANAGGTTTDSLKIGCTTGQGQNLNFDDLYILNTSGAANNTFLGDSRIVTQVPNSDGTHTAWTPSSGTNRYSRVNEIPPDGDSSYIFDSTPGDENTFGFPATTISGTGVVAAVQVNMCARKDDVTTRSIEDLCHSGGSDFAGANIYALITTYLIYRQIRETDPATGLAWTLAGVNAAQFGVIAQ